MAVPLLGVGFAVLAAVGLALQSLAVRLGARTHSLSEIIAVVFVVNLLGLVPVAGVVQYPRYLVVAGAAVFLQDDERVTWRLGSEALVVVVGTVLVVGA